MIRVACDDFPLLPAPPVVSDIEVSWADMIWAAVTVGRRMWADVIAHGIYSYFEFIYRICILRANLRGQAGHFTRSAAYNRLDPSEKGAVSYFIGLTLGKFLCDEILDAPWMMHLDVYHNQLQPLITRAGGRPDLVGEDIQQRWIVCEAKGRTRGFSSAALERAKDQTKLIDEIAGQVPFLRVAVLSYFFNRRLSAYFVDPDEVGPRPSRLRISHDRLLRDYYRPLLALVEGSRSRLQSHERVTRLPEVDVSIGIDEAVYDFARREAYDELIGRTKEIQPIAGIEKRKVGKDGISIELGPTWDGD